MAELHKFRDDVRSKEGRVKPISARHLDENLKTVRLKLSDSLKTFLKITQSAGVEDELDFVVQPPSAEAVPVFEGGQFSRWEETKGCE